jgi:signal transduction histidine kinase
VIHSRLFSKVYSLIVIVLLLVGTGVYVMSVPYIERISYQMEKKHAHHALEITYELVDDIQRQLADYRRHAVDSRKEELRHLLQVAEAFVRLSLHSAAASDTLQYEQARQKLFEQLRTFQYGHSDYFWIADYTSRLVSHPDPELHGSDFSKVQDIYGNLIVSPMVEQGRREGEAYYSYWWRRLGAQHPSEKLSYCRDFPEYNIIVGTGLYLDDVENDVAELRRIAIERLRERLRGITIGATGYVYIFDKNYQMLIHPNANVEGKSAEKLLNPLTGKLITEELIAKVDDPDGHNYKWDSPDDPNNYIYDKISWMKYHQGLGWYIASSVYTDELKNNAQTLQQRLLWVGIAALLISLGLGWLFAKRLTAPIHELAETAKQITGGDLSARSTLRSDDEIGVLALAFNRMVEQLRDHIDNLDAKVNARTAELEHAYSELQRLERMKSELLSSISHELRTPLTSIQGFAKLLERDLKRMFPTLPENDPKLRKSLDRIDKNLAIVLSESKHLAELIARVIKVSLLESDEAEWHDSDTALDEVVATAVERVRLLLVKKPELHLEQDADSGIMLHLDRQRLEDVMVELLDNAIKFSAQGVIRIQRESDGTTVTLSVSDQGIGIAPAQHERIFERFQQVTNEADDLIDKPHGTGLGLTLCRDVVTHYGGSIEVESTLGKGSCFRVKLPQLPLSI